MSDDSEPDCTCWPFRNRKEPYDPECPFHGKNGSMVVKVDLAALTKAVAESRENIPSRPITGGFIAGKQCPHCGGDVPL